MNSKRSSYRGFGVYLLLILAVIGIWYWMDGNTSTNSYTRAQFETAVADGNVAQLKIVPNRGEVPTGNVYITFKDSSTQVLAVNDVNDIEDYLRDQQFTSYTVENPPEQSWIVTILPYLIIFAAMFIFFMIMTNQAAANSGGGGKMMNFGKSRAKLMTDDPAKRVTFANVAGLKEEKEELEEIVDFLNARARENQWGFVDFNRPMVAINQWEQAEDSMYTLCGKDRIHPSTDGHLVMAYLFLKAQGLAGKPVADIRIDGAGKKVTRSDNCRVSDLSVSSDNLTFTYEAKSLPYPIDTSYYDNEKHTQADALSVIPFMDEMNYEGLSVSGLSDGYYGLTIGGEFIGRFTARELERGINMTLLQNTPQYKQAMKIRQMNEERWLKERKMREFYWVEYNLMRKTGMLWACNEAAVDTLRKYRPHDIFLQWNGDLWLQYMHKGIREDCVNEQQDLVNRIYEQNKPIPLRIEIKKFTDL